MVAMQTTQRNVIIAGAGPAGMALAYLLARRGIGVTVLESHRDFARSFRGEGLQRSGIDAFRQMGLAEQLDRVPHATIDAVELYNRGTLRLRTDPAAMGRGGARNVSQPALLEMLASEARRFAGFSLRTGVTVRDLIRENGRVVGVRASEGARQEELGADLVIGADGRNSATRKQSGLTETLLPQGYDVVWIKSDYPQAYPGRATAIFEMNARRAVLAMPAADGRLQIGFVIPKGSFVTLRASAPEVWSEMLIGQLPAYMADHLRANRELLTGATLLNVICGRLSRWTVPGLLLIGDAAHPMSPVGGQGVNLALRDALVAANHLVPALASAAAPAAIDAAAARVETDRLPEIAAAQQMQDKHARMMFSPDNWRNRLVHRLLPLMIQSGLLQRLHRQEYRQMSEGFFPVTLTA